jgi:ABC-type sugar transport system ATPase subunit
MADNLISARGITKAFGGTRALDGVDFDVPRGQIVGLVGENGAGKSTLLKVLAGLHDIDAGQLLIDGEAVGRLTPKASQDLGFVFIHQEVQVVPGMSVAETMHLGMPTPTRLGLISRQARRARAQEVLDQLEMDINPDAKMSQLSLVEQVDVAIARAVGRDSRLVVMDEPTASFSPREVERLFTIVRRLRDQGRTVIYVSHRLDEIIALCDCVTVMRSGRRTADHHIIDITKQSLIGDIIGESLAAEVAARTFELPTPGAPLLRLTGLQGELVGPVDLIVREGEIVGIGGLVGSGRSRLVRLLYGADKRLAGTVHVGEKELRRATPAEAVRAGIGLVPEDRGRQGFIGTLSIRENATLPTLRSFTSRTGWIGRGAQRVAVGDIGERLHLRMPSVEAPVSALSGGNAQKVVIAKWLLAESRVLVFDEPTRGIDIGAKEDVFRLMIEAAAGGAAVVVVSSELDELQGLCHRVIVMREGRVVGELVHGDVTSRNILELCYEH